MPKTLKYILIAIAALLGVGLLTLALLDWNTFKGPVTRIASQRLGKPVAIDGDLKVKLFSLTPSVDISGLKIGNPEWAGTGNFAEVERFSANVKLLPLFAGNIIVPRLEVDRPVLNLYRDVSGRGNWEAPSTTPQERSRPLKLPAVRLFVLNDGKLQLRDEIRKMQLTATVVAAEQGGTEQGEERPFRLDGIGKINGEAFKLQARGGPLINIDQTTPYGFDGEVQAGQTQVKIAGSITKPFDFGDYEAKLDLSGPDLADLYYLTELALPNTAPYRLSGQLHRRGTRYDLDQLAGLVGDSDMRGTLTIETASGRPKVSGDLNSQRLNLDDLLAPLGAVPATAKEQELSPKQKRIAETMAAEQKILPDAKLDVTRVKGMDATVHFKAESVTARKIPMRKVTMDISLQDGVLTLKPVAFEFPQGAVTADVKLDANPGKPRTDIDLRLTKLRLEDFLKKTDSPPALQGTLLGRAQVHGTGSSVHEVASTADGTVTMVVPQGEIRQAFAELTGINVAKGLGLLLKKDQEKTTVRCGVAGFKMQNGTLNADSIVVDTDEVLITGEGDIELGPERLNLKIKGAPKKLRLLRLRAPIELKGSLRKPAVGIEAEKAVAQGGVAVAIGSLLSPVAALLAFIDPGLAKDANCVALLEQAKEQGVAVKPADGKAQ